MVTYTLTIESGANGTTDPVPGDYEEEENAEVEVEAIPEEDYVFNGWRINGVLKTFSNPYTVTVTGDMTVLASFKEFIDADGGETYYYYKTR